MILTESNLHSWMMANGELGRQILPELIGRLVAASVLAPTFHRFPFGDSAGQHGADGELDSEFGFAPYVPDGRSHWEFGAGRKPQKKATDDYREKTAAVPEGTRKSTSFIFVTPLSGTHEWEWTWKKQGIAAWIKRRKSKAEWKDVHVIDGTQLTAWINRWPAVQEWLAGKMGYPIDDIFNLQGFWEPIRTVGDPPPLMPEVFLTGRTAAQEKLKLFFEDESHRQLKLETRQPSHAAYFVAAHVASLDAELSIKYESRCLVILSAAAWQQTIRRLTDPHVLIAAWNIDDDDDECMRLLRLANGANHRIVWSGNSGGLAPAFGASLADPKPYDLEKALRNNGYHEERARELAHRSEGKLGIFLKLVGGLSLYPEWAKGDDASQYKILQLIAQFNLAYAGDKKAIGDLLGKTEGEWIEEIQKLLHRPGTPLIQNEGKWSFQSRFEAWLSLGPQLHDNHLEKWAIYAKAVLGEKDPKFELPPDKRYAASIYGKSPTFSQQARTAAGITLALFGNHYRSLTSCTTGLPQSLALQVVRVLLEGSDWVSWASLDRLLPLLAEAAPTEFLRQVDKALENDAKIFRELFAQESSGATGSTYMSGLLWALETLAWDPNYLGQVLVTLGNLSAVDPGGNWGNRPDRSAADIVLPWHPQTVASIDDRVAAVRAMVAESPGAGWKILLRLLPGSREHTSGTHRPEWMDVIPGDWGSTAVTVSDFWKQSDAYSIIAIEMATADPEKMAELVAEYDHLSPDSRKVLLTTLGSESILGLPEDRRYAIWRPITDLVARHRKYSDSDWAVSEDILLLLEGVAEKIQPRSPLLKHLRIFTENFFDLMEKERSFEEENARIEVLRQDAVAEIFSAGGLQAIVEFSEKVAMPGNVGYSFGNVAPDAVDRDILPKGFVLFTGKARLMVGGFVLGRFIKKGWPWVDASGLEGWKIDEKNEILKSLPFGKDAWDRVAQHLGDKEELYWKAVQGNVYQVREHLDFAVEKLLQYGRAGLALEGLALMRHNHEAIDPKMVVRVLFGLLDDRTPLHSMSRLYVEDAIKDLQNSPDTPAHEMLKIEWAYLPLLGRFSQGSPTKLENELANNSNFFCEVVQMVFKSEFDEEEDAERTEQEQKLAQNGYHLLDEWMTVPGSRDGEAFDGNVLNEWFSAVRAKCEESGHLSMALSQLGKVLTHCPPDSTGLWIHKSAAKILNLKESDDMRRSFCTALFNSRGAFVVDGGKSEEKLSKMYLKKAKALDQAGFPRFAASVRELGLRYHEDAERVVRRAELGEY